MMVCFPLLRIYPSNSPTSFFSLLGIISVEEFASAFEKTFETPTEHSYLNYCNFINNHTPYWNNLKLGVFYLDIDYDANYKANYSNKIIPNMESTLTEGLINFMRGV